MKQFVGTVSLATALVTAGTGLAADRYHLARSDALGVDVYAQVRGGEWCSESLQLDVVGKDARLFKSDDLRTLLQKLSTLIERRCPDAQEYLAKGTVSGAEGEVYQATASRQEGWRPETRMRAASGTAAGEEGGASAPEANEAHAGMAAASDGSVKESAGFGEEQQSAEAANAAPDRSPSAGSHAGSPDPGAGKQDALRTAASGGGDEARSQSASSRMPWDNQPPSVDRPPQAGKLQQKFLLEMPGYWNLTAFNVQAAANYGTAVEPIIKQRFVAEVAVIADTYALDTKEGAVTWVAPVAARGESRIVHGIATSTWTAGAWQTDFAMESNPMPGLGQPQSAFSGRVIVRGSPEEAAFYEAEAKRQQEQAARKHEAELARLQREQAIKAQEGQAELARLAHEEKLREEQRKAEERKAAAAKAKKEAQLKELAEQAKNRLAIALPGYWTLTGFESGNASTSGTADQPVYEQNFSADIKLAKDLFAEAGKEGSVTFVTPIAEAGDSRRVYGTARSALKSGQWETSLQIENDPSSDAGRPLDFFSGRVIVKGSEEEQAYRQKVHEEELARRKHEEDAKAQQRELELSQQKREEEAKEQERQAELARLEHQRKLEEEKRKAEQALPPHTIASGISAILRNAGKSKDTRSVSVSLTLENTTDKDLRIALVGPQPMAIDNTGGNYELKEFSGTAACSQLNTYSINLCMRNFPAQSYTQLSPGSKITLSYAFYGNPSSGNEISFSSNFALLEVLRNDQGDGQPEMRQSTVSFGIPNIKVQGGGS